jgi:hypothetical protein
MSNNEQAISNLLAEIEKYYHEKGEGIKRDWVYSDVVPFAKNTASAKRYN